MKIFFRSFFLLFVLLIIASRANTLEKKKVLLAQPKLTLEQQARQAVIVTDSELDKMQKLNLPSAEIQIAEPEVKIYDRTWTGFLGLWGSPVSIQGPPTTYQLKTTRVGGQEKIWLWGLEPGIEGQFIDYAEFGWRLSLPVGFSRQKTTLESATESFALELNSFQWALKTGLFYQIQNWRLKGFVDFELGQLQLSQISEVKSARWTETQQMSAIGVGIGYLVTRTIEIHSAYRQQYEFPQPTVDQWSISASGLHVGAKYRW